MLCAGPHRLSFNNGCAGGRRCPQLKRDPLGRSAHITFSTPERRRMRTYLLTTGILFVVIAGAHVFEVIDRGHIHHSDILIVAVSAGLSVWAWRLWRKAAA